MNTTGHNTNRVWINELTFNDGNKIEFDKDDIVVFVGSNNAGKSVCLREIKDRLNQSQSVTKIITDAKFEIEGTVQDFCNNLEQCSQVIYQPHDKAYSGFNYYIQDIIIKNVFSNHKKGLGQLGGFFVNHITTEARLSASRPPQNVDLRKLKFEHPIHFLQKNGSLEDQFSKYFNQAFGEDLILHRNAGSLVPLHVGAKPNISDKVSCEYFEALAILPGLDEQGDGMRSFVGVLLNLIVSQYSIQLIDEPEAFLHPPQERLLGKIVAKDFSAGRQLFIATHSEDFLKGLLESGNKNIKIIRIQREGNLNKTCLLNQEEVRHVWSESLLKYSNVFSSLFHSKVILCEDAADCVFYAALVNAHYEKAGKAVPDWLFLHCGGKGKMPIIIKIVKKFDIPITVITDFDILNAQNPLQLMVSDLEGVWDSIKTDWSLVKNSIDLKKPTLPVNKLKSAIDTIFSELASQPSMEKNNIEKIKDLLKQSSSWSEAKQIGKSFIPSGEATQAFDRLNAYCKKIGLWIVPVGELERFVPSIGNHGQKWVNAVLEKNLNNDPELEVARRFIAELIA